MSMWDIYAGTAVEPQEVKEASKSTINWDEVYKTWMKIVQPSTEDVFKNEVLYKYLSKK